MNNYNRTGAGKTPKTALSLDNIMAASGDNYLPSYNPFDEELADYRHSLLLRALPIIIDNELTELQRRCIRMYYFKGMSQYEIASILGIQVPAVCKHLDKGISRLRVILGYLLS